jgi:murein DD-endopeptidase MepM/ murein hydrolase activator NlpD
MMRTPRHVAVVILLLSLMSCAAAPQSGRGGVATPIALPAAPRVAELHGPPAPPPRSAASLPPLPAPPFPELELAVPDDRVWLAALRQRAAALPMAREPETNVRSGPGRIYQPLTQIAPGQALDPLAQYEGWVQIAVGEIVGWVRADLLRLPDGALEQLPAALEIPPPPPQWVWPTWGELTSPFGNRWVPFRSFHNGIDIANASGTSIRAARSGWVTAAGWCSGYGYCVKITHTGGFQTIYGHLREQPVVSAGQEVAAGDLIGRMGMTYDAAGGGYADGVHLHFTVLRDGKAVDPLAFLP